MNMNTMQNFGQLCDSKVSFGFAKSIYVAIHIYVQWCHRCDNWTGEGHSVEHYLAWGGRLCRAKRGRAQPARRWLRLPHSPCPPAPPHPLHTRAAGSGGSGGTVTLPAPLPNTHSGNSKSPVKCIFSQQYVLQYDRLQSEMNEGDWGVAAPRCHTVCTI